MDIIVILGIIIVFVIIIGLFLYKISSKPLNTEGSPANLYKILGGNADVWWNKVKINGPNTINQTTGEPFKIKHIRNITIKAIDTPIEVEVNKNITYSKLRIHPDINDYTTNGTSKRTIYKFPINETTNYYTLEAISKL